MKRAGLIVATLLVLSMVGLILHQVWPKYGICRETSRYDEIVCVARRNLHFSAHFTWSFNSYTVEAVMAEVGRDDIEVLAAMLGDERSMLRSLAGNILSQIGEDGLARLKRAAASADPVIRHTAKIALMDYEIVESSRQPQQ